MFRRTAVTQGLPVADRGEVLTARTAAPTARTAAPTARTAVPSDRTAGPRRARSRKVATGTAGAVGTGMLALGRLVRLVSSLLALVIAAGIALIALDAHSTNSVVSTVHDAARSLVGPFDGMFSASSHKLTIAINWGIALVIYLAVGSLLAGLIARVGAGARSRAATAR
jgi:hypothetical protein